MNAAIKQMADAENLDDLLHRNAACFNRDSPVAVQKIRTDVVMRKQAWLLEDISDWTFIEGQAAPDALVLPDFVAELQKAIWGTFESGETSQERGLSCSRGAEDRGHA
jgi:hypothetical protein